MFLAKDLYTMYHIVPVFKSLLFNKASTFEYYADFKEVTSYLKITVMRHKFLSGQEE